MFFPHLRKCRRAAVKGKTMKQDFDRLIQEQIARAGRKGLTSRELCDKLRVKRQQREAVLFALYKAVKSGSIKEKKGRYRAAKSEKLISARIVSVKEGFGFAGGEELERDIFIPGRALKGAMPGDDVLIRRIVGRGELPEGEVARIVSQNNAPFSGVFVKKDGRCVIQPDSGSKIAVKVLLEDTLGARDGDKVLGRLTLRADSHFGHQAEVTDVFGRASSAAACSEAILAAAGVEKQFSDEVMLFADSVSRQVIGEKETKNRMDLRGEMIFTIDGADTKDIDDAISLTKSGDGWTLGVHIADVSHYVKPGTPLDEQAYERGTSIYYANAVVPMLPPALSNGICSLNPEEDRLAFSALLSIDHSGVLTSFEFKKTIIRSCIKGVYNEINEILAQTADEIILNKYAEQLETIAQMRELAAVLQKRRMSRGGLNLQSAESKILVGEDGRAQGVVGREQGVAENIIEEFMLTANEAAATLAMRQDIPFVYRVHENPSEEKIAKLCELLDALGVGCGTLKTQVSSGALAQVLESVRGTGLELMVNNQILRSMAKAKYSEINKGHFGLVLGNYAHFTSPIRRYPDLAIHRILTSFLAGQNREKLEEKYASFVKAAGEQSSGREQRAMTIERDCEACYKAEYMARHIGEEFDGIITSVTARGIYVELTNTVEGMLRVDSLPAGNYEYDGLIQLTETASGTHYRVGMPMRVLVAGADVSAGNVDFVPAKLAI